MKEGYQIILVPLIIIGFALGVAWIFFSGIDAKIERENKIVLDEGIITDLKIQNDGGLGSYTLYIIELDGKDYETIEDIYNLLSIGDHIRIYKGGKIEVLENE